MSLHSYFYFSQAQVLCTWYIRHHWFFGCVLLLLWRLSSCFQHKYQYVFRIDTLLRTCAYWLQFQGWAAQAPRHANVLLTSSEKFKGSNPTSPTSSPVSLSGRGVNGSAMDASGSAAIDSWVRATSTKERKGRVRAWEQPAL